MTLHRTPLDFTEVDSQLVSGFNIEYGSSMCALMFMAQYMHISMMSLLLVSNIMKSYYSTDLMTMGTIVSFMFIWTRGALPLWKSILQTSD